MFRLLASLLELCKIVLEQDACTEMQIKLDILAKLAYISPPFPHFSLSHISAHSADPNEGWRQSRRTHCTQGTLFLCFYFLLAKFGPTPTGSSVYCVEVMLFTKRLPKGTFPKGSYILLCGRILGCFIEGL